MLSNIASYTLTHTGCEYWCLGAGLLALLISGRLTLANISPLALTLSNTYGEWLLDSQAHDTQRSQLPSVALDSCL